MSFPPPPRPASRSTDAPGFPSRAQLRAQQREYQRQQSDQARVFRQQARAIQNRARLERRASQRSVVGPLLLLAAGILLLLAQTGHLNWDHTLSWYAHWWPAILIGAGAVLLLEWALDRHNHTPSTRVLGPGVGFLLVLLAAFGWSLRSFDFRSDLPAYLLGDSLGLQHMLGRSHEWDESSTADLVAGSTLTVHNPRGSVTISGSSQDGRVHLSTHGQTYAWQDSSAEDQRRRLEPKISHQTRGLLVDIASVEDAEADLTLVVPHDTPVTLRTDDGATSLTGLHGAVVLQSRGGEVTLEDIDGSIAAHVDDDQVSVTGHQLSGPVVLHGRTGDLGFSDVAGPLTLEGDFFGGTHLQHINGAVRFQTSRTHFEAARLAGSLNLEGGPDLQAEGVTGPVVLTTKDRNVLMDHVSGSVQISNRNGTVDLSSLSPLGSIQIANERGSVDVALPDNAGFRVLAEARNGEIENDFGLSSQDHDKLHILSGTFDGGGPDVHITTSDGGITLRRSSGTTQHPHEPRLPVPSLSPVPPLSLPPGRHLSGRAPSLQRM